MAACAHPICHSIESCLSLCTQLLCRVNSPSRTRSHSTVYTFLLFVLCENAPLPLQCVYITCLLHDHAQAITSTLRPSLSSASHTVTLKTIIFTTMPHLLFLYLMPSIGTSRLCRTCLLCTSRTRAL